MAAKTSSGAAVIAGQSALAGSSYGTPSSNCQSASQDLTTSLGALWTLRGVPGSTLTTGCSWQVDVSYDGTTWRQFVLGVFGLASGALYDAVIEMPLPAMYTRVTFFGPSATTMVSAELSRATGIT
jgi:hypothetical protein